MDRSDRRVIELVLRHLPRGTEENHEKSVGLSIVFSWDPNLAPTEYKKSSGTTKIVRLVNHYSDWAMPACVIVFVCANYVVDFLSTVLSSMQGRGA
jgi:hypothetical protein